VAAPPVRLRFGHPLAAMNKYLQAQTPCYGRGPRNTVEMASPWSDTAPRRPCPRAPADRRHPAGGAFYDRFSPTRATPFKTELRLDYNWRWCLRHCLQFLHGRLPSLAEATTNPRCGLRYRREHRFYLRILKPQGQKFWRSTSAPEP